MALHYLDESKKKVKFILFFLFACKKEDFLHRKLRSDLESIYLKLYFFQATPKCILFFGFMTTITAQICMSLLRKRIKFLNFIKH